MSIIGREPPADIVIPAPQVSARHAEIRHLSGDRYSLFDLGSSNGTFVNGIRIDSTTIRPTDDVRLGSQRIDLPSLLSLLHASAAVEPSLPGPLQPSVPLTLPRYAGFWLRFAAALLDGLIVTFSLTLLAVSWFAIQGWRPTFIGLPEVLGVLSVRYPWVSLVAPWLYWSLFESSELQATPGKVALGLRVADLAGTRLTFGRATGRYFAKWLSVLTLFVGYLMAGFTRRKQALHDLVAGTVIVRR